MNWTVLVNPLDLIFAIFSLASFLAYMLPIAASMAERVSRYQASVLWRHDLVAQKLLLGSPQPGGEVSRMYAAGHIT